VRGLAGGGGCGNEGVESEKKNMCVERREVEKEEEGGRKREWGGGVHALTSTSVLSRGRRAQVFLRKKNVSSSWVSPKKPPISKAICRSRKRQGSRKTKSAKGARTVPLGIWVTKSPWRNIGGGARAAAEGNEGVSRNKSPGKSGG